MCVCVFGTKRACNHDKCIINTVSCRCTIILDKSPGPAISNITIPATHQKYTCTMKGNTSFLSSQRWRLREAKGSRVSVRAKYLQKVGLLSNAQLIKLWCIPSPCSSSRLLLFIPPIYSPAMPACPITPKLVFVLVCLAEHVFFPQWPMV